MGMRWSFVALILSLWVCAPAWGQMSVDEAMERLQEREAERAAAATQPAATEPSQLGDARAELGNLSLRVHDLEGEVREDFSGAIGVMWTPSATQEWLDQDGAKAAGDVMKVAGSSARAKIIVENVDVGPKGEITVTGHLFSDEQVSLTNADRTALKPQQDQYDSANDRLASLQNQLREAQTDYQFATMHERATGQTGPNGMNVLSAYNGPSPALLTGQISNLQSEIVAAQNQVSSAGQALSAGQTQLLEADRAHMQVWGPITLRTGDAELVKKLPGAIVTVAVRVTKVGVDVIRRPDGAAWDFSSDLVAEGGVTKMPTSLDDAAGGMPDVGVTIDVSCDDLSAPPEERQAPTGPGREGTPDEGDAKLASATMVTGSSGAAAGYVESPRDEDAMAAAVGFVVVGYQAELPDGRTLRRPLATGSCFAVTPTGYLLTNRHVVADKEFLDDPSVRDAVRDKWNVDIESHVWVLFSGRQYDAEVVYVSGKNDLAVLHVPRRGQIYFRLAAQADEARGDDVYAAGFPGLGRQALSAKEVGAALQADDAMNPDQDIKSEFNPRDFEYTLTKGAIGRCETDGDGQRWIQHEAVIRHGNSGGPLLDETGAAIGINTAGQMSDQGESSMNLSLELAQFRAELDAHVPGLVWVGR
jgi:S1-C subfamily serine protease